ncbi:hypothetical protein Riv7116_0149 [Rivularia sp. PCC 7116]|uniref:hypothetical protein n=1 Tax=Rivularia sp. PCC 7116 TaxID=373994 RepID=UPI00029ECB3A|nr:hypothetical protein [Rivularia sp. PCC 7116]AFY52758.1 hypothetical protein Riv7116_0149 [Rivularia sp. PCC 7116]
MAQGLLFVLFKAVWQDMMSDIAYDSTKQNWQAFQLVFDESKKSQQLGLDLTVALERCFYSSKKVIAEKCREHLIKNSTFIQYRGAKIYSPPEHDRDIKILDSNIKLLEKQLKKIGKKNHNHQSIIKMNLVEDYLKQISHSNNQSFQQDKHVGEKLFEEANKDCDVNILKSALRDEKYGFRKLMLKNFLIEIEPNEELNSIFNARTYLILHQVRNKF